MKATLLLFAASLAVVPAQAQITITEADVRAQLQGRSTSTVFVTDDASPLAALVNRTGANQTYDFRAADFALVETISTETVVCADTIPGCDDPTLNTANLILRSATTAADDSTTYTFHNLAEGGFWVLGAAAEGDFDDEVPGVERFTISFTPALLGMKLPLVMNESWGSDLQVTTRFPGQDPFSWRVIEEYVVDGWGTLQTPDGEASALRVKNESITHFDLGGTVLVDTSYTIQFVTKGRLSASLDLDAAGQLIGASYSVLEAGTAVEPGDDVPGRFALAANYPNPFNPQTTIPFTLHAAGAVRLAVFDVLGREVAVLVDEARPAGAYRVTWQANDLPSGLYLYRLTMGGESVTRCMTLLK